MNYYPFHLGDYTAHTAHLEPMEDLAYRRMLDLYYMREAPLPSDPVEVARLVRMRQCAAEVEAVLREFFTLTDCGWVNVRCAEEIAHMQEKQAKAKASAHASVRARKAKAEQSQSDGETSVERPVNERSAEVELPTPTPTPTPTPNSVPNGTGVKPPKLTDPSEIIFGYGLTLLVNAGTPEKQARSFLGGLRKVHGDQVLIDKLRSCAQEKPLQPLEWLAAALPPPLVGGSGRAPNKQEALEQRNREIGDEWLADMMARESAGGA